MKVLITSGPTREPLDAVRFITNLSSGYTGQAVADVFAAQNHDVVFVHGDGSLTPSDSRVKAVSFSSFGDLNERLRGLLGNDDFDVVIHAAAVSDYGVAEVVANGRHHPGPLNGKIDSGEDIEIKLSRHFKIVHRLKAYSKNPDLVVVAFKLTSTAAPEDRRAAVARLDKGGGVDYVVQNDLSERISREDHRFYVSRHGEPAGQAGSARELGRVLEKMLRRTQ